MENSKTLFAARKELADAQAAAMADGNTDEARIIEGQIKQIDITLEHTLEEEDRLRNSVATPKPAPATLAEQILGARDSFKGLEEGFRNELVTIPATKEIDTTVVGKSASLLTNFASTLQSVQAAGSVSFLQRTADTGAVDTRAAGAAAAVVTYNWKEAVANKETIAGYVPVSRDSLRDYSELESIIMNDLLIDLAMKKDAKFLTGNNASGIVGVMNTVGVGTFTPTSDAASKGGKYYDSIRSMRTSIIKNSHTIPTHICASPEILEAIDLYRTNEGLYQAIGGNIIHGMTVCEDVNCDGIVVYDKFAALERPVYGASVSVGTISDQFIKSQLCILLEETTALQVRRPDAFCVAKASAFNAAA